MSSITQHKRLLMMFSLLVLLAAGAYFVFGQMGTAKAARFVVDFRQCSNENPTLGDCVWINGIIQQNNSVWFEGMSVPQRTLFKGIPATMDNVHVLTFSHETTKGRTHAYDFLTSYEQAVEAADALDVAYINLSGDDFTVAEACSANIGPPGNLESLCVTDLRGSGNSVDVAVPDVHAFISKDGTVNSRIAAYELASATDRVITLYGDGSEITNALLTLVQIDSNTNPLGNTDDTGDSSILYTLTWTSASDMILLEMAGHLAVSGDGTGVAGARTKVRPTSAVAPTTSASTNWTAPPWGPRTTGSWPP